MFDADKTRMIGLPCGEETMLSRFHTGTSRTDGRTDWQNCYINQQTRMTTAVLHVGYCVFYRHILSRFLDVSWNARSPGTKGSTGTKVPTSKERKFLERERKFSLWTFRSRERKCIWERKVRSFWRSSYGVRVTVNMVVVGKRFYRPYIQYLALELILEL